MGRLVDLFNDPSALTTCLVLGLHEEKSKENYRPFWRCFVGDKPDVCIIRGVPYREGVTPGITGDYQGPSSVYTSDPISGDWRHYSNTRLWEIVKRFDPVDDA